MARPTKSKQVDMEKILLEHFQEHHSAIYTAKLTGYNRNTVNAYFRTFAQKLLEEVDGDFVTRQKLRKELVIAKLEEDITALDNQLEQILKFTGTGEIEEGNASLHGVRLNIITARANLRQQIADIDMTPTLDVSLDKLVEEVLDEAKSSGNSTEKA